MVSNSEAIHSAMMELSKLREEKKVHLAKIQELIAHIQKVEGENQELRERLIDFGEE